VRRIHKRSYHWDCRTTAYFPMNVQMNRGVNSSIDEVLRRGLTSIKPNAFKALAQDDDFLVLDVRTPQELAPWFRV
jgi:predicted sulfurtransferase